MDLKQIKMTLPSRLPSFKEIYIKVSEVWMRYGEKLCGYYSVSNLALLLVTQSCRLYKGIADIPCQKYLNRQEDIINLERIVLMDENVRISYWPARLRKKIEWVSLMLRLSSRTNVLPSARAQCNMDANASNKRTLLSKTLSLLWVITPVRLIDDDTELDRFVCMTATSDTILQQKSTSALAVVLTLTPRSSQSQRGTRPTEWGCANSVKALF